MDEFLALFGKINVSTVIMVGAAIYFMFNIYRKFSNTIIENHEKDKERDKQIKIVLDEVNKYPTYRQQSIEVQKELRSDIKNLTVAVEKIGQRQDEIETERKQRKLNELREKLTALHQMYTSPEKNPKQAWTALEKEAFNGIFDNYESLGGNSFMHTVVRPDMDRLRVIPMHESAEILALMQSRK